jgi:outer membrane protein, heavy metal efflux system
MRHPFCWLRSVAGFLGPVLVVVLGGCATYQARPIDPAVTHAHWQTRRLDDPALARRVRGLLPPRDHGHWPPLAYGRAELLLVALELNPQLAEARAALAESSAAVTSARALPNPTVSLALERYTEAQAGSRPWLWGISTDLLLDTALRRRLRTQLADAGVRGARLDYGEAVWKVDRSLRSALADLLLARQETALAEQAVTTAGELQEGMQQRHALGETGPGGVLLAAQSLARARGDAAAAAQREADALARLARAVGVPASALAGVPLRWEAFDQPRAPDPARLQPLVERALLSRPDLEQALVAYDRREIELHQQVRAQYPQLSLGPGYTYDHGIRKLTFNASASLPVFNQNQGPIAEARARREAAGLHVEAVQAGIDNEIQAAMARLQLALQALHAARSGEQAAETQLGQTEHAQALGAEDHLAVMDARMIVLAARQTALAALDQAHRAQAALEDALRTPLDPAEAGLLSPVAGEPR